MLSKKTLNMTPKGCHLQRGRWKGWLAQLAEIIQSQPSASSLCLQIMPCFCHCPAGVWPHWGVLCRMENRGKRVAKPALFIQMSSALSQPREGWFGADTQLCCRLPHCFHPALTSLLIPGRWLWAEQHHLLHWDPAIPCPQSCRHAVSPRAGWPVNQPSLFTWWG